MEQFDRQIMEMAEKEEIIVPNGFDERVQAALEDLPPRQKKRKLGAGKVALIAAAVCALLLTGAAAASGVLELPFHNVLSAFYPGENVPGSELLVGVQPLSVSDDNYTFTITSYVADRNDIYFTMDIEARTDLAEAVLKSLSLTGDPIITNIPGGVTTYSGYDPDTRTAQVEVDAYSYTEDLSNEVAVRFIHMEEGLWLNFQVQPASDLTLCIDAKGRGISGRYPRELVPVTLNTVIISPLTCHAEYTADEDYGFPDLTLQFLWADGTVSGTNRAWGHGRGGGNTGGVYEYEYTWRLDSVRDLSQLSAVIFDGMAYPVDGSEPYEIDVDAVLDPS